MKLKLNKKGFTLVEILATVAIMAVLSGVAVTATTKYLEKTRQESYKAMESAAFAAAQNYVQQRNPIIPVFDDAVESSLSVSPKLSATYANTVKEALGIKGKRAASRVCHNSFKTGQCEYVYRLIDDFTPATTLNDANGILNPDRCKNCFYVLDVSTLVEQEYLDELKDPKATDKTCGGKVYIAKEKSLSQYEYWSPNKKGPGEGAYVGFETGRLDSYVYLVEIECYDYISSHKVMSVGADGEKNTKDDEETSQTARGVLFYS